MFGQRVRATARRMGIPVEPIDAAQARSHQWQSEDVVVLQATLRPDRQLELVEEIRQRRPAPIVVAVTGHLETELRRRLKSLGAVLAAHSAMDRVLARALGVSADADDVGAQDAEGQPQH